MVGRNATTRIDDGNRGIAFQRQNLNPNCSRKVVEETLDSLPQEFRSRIRNVAGLWSGSDPTSR